jgi:hypothetical protein
MIAGAWAAESTEKEAQAEARPSLLRPSTARTFHRYDRPEAIECGLRV